MDLRSQLYGVSVIIAALVGLVLAFGADWRELALFGIILWISIAAISGRQDWRDSSS